MTASDTYDSTNIFARILRGEIPVKKLHEDKYALAFPDIAPKAPVHILVIPTGAYLNLHDFGLRASEEEIAGFWKAVARIAADQGIAESGFRTIANTGVNGGQEVPHFHVHLLGGGRIGPMVSR